MDKSKIVELLWELIAAASHGGLESSREFGFDMKKLELVVDMIVDPMMLDIRILSAIADSLSDRIIELERRSNGNDRNIDSLIDRISNVEDQVDWSIK